MTQNQLKEQAAIAAIQYVQKDSIVGVGTGSTVNFFIDALAAIKNNITGAVASSIVTHNKLKDYGIKVFDLNQVKTISCYIDGADEINKNLAMIKGGGGALTREKIIASAADKFICIADDSKLVNVLGGFPLPVEVIPMATNIVSKVIKRDVGGTSKLRDYTTDNGNKILDISGLNITNPQALEAELNNIVGVVSNGIFARRCADILIMGTTNGVKTIKSN